ncbi:hypothetical protein [Ferribacterium limneticum]|uniref:hypothetical protein n=1 Tax=Ferribacterium limneticum TaxID=76259 RepID=UPI001CFB8779|nr:hypothetical protein [Ferribacterium limneticum]UCV28888.1 hypothetical protein KI617_01915 [Ferribacterium limneticum]UCV32806.1 hypothetical protein KI608_01915 [Ferribacterium limneticum]
MFASILCCCFWWPPLEKAVAEPFFRTEAQTVRIAGTFPEGAVQLASIFKLTCETTMDELSYFGIGFTVLILGLACLMAVKLSSKTAYH